MFVLQGCRERLRGVHRVRSVTVDEAVPVDVVVGVIGVVLELPFAKPVGVVVDVEHHTAGRLALLFGEGLERSERGVVLTDRRELPVRQRIDAGDDAGATLSFGGVHDDDELTLLCVGFELLGDDLGECSLARETCLTALPVLAI